jgi:hypothetical protein
MGRKRNKEEHSEQDEQAIKELKAANRRLKSDNQRLKAELATLHDAFEKTSVYLKSNTDNVSVEKIVEEVRKGSDLDQIKKHAKFDKCEKCGSYNLKNLQVPAVGRIILCGDCKHRKVVKNEEKN